MNDLFSGKEMDAGIGCALGLVVLLVVFFPLGLLFVLLITIRDISNGEIKHWDKGRKVALALIFLILSPICLALSYVGLTSSRVGDRCLFLPSQLSVGMRIEQIPSHHSDLDIVNMGGFTIFDTPPASQPGLFHGSISENVKVTVLDGPVCKNFHTWWHVKTDGGETGWISDYWPAYGYTWQPVK